MVSWCDEGVRAGDCFLSGSVHSEGFKSIFPTRQCWWFWAGAGWLSVWQLSATNRFIQAVEVNKKKVFSSAWDCLYAQHKNAFLAHASFSFAWFGENCLHIDFLTMDSFMIVINYKSNKNVHLNAKTDGTVLK